jgi:hypothetical protein
MILTGVFDFLVRKPEVASAFAAIGSTLLAVVGVVVSLIALYESHAALKHQREHNRLSVRPLAYVVVGDYETNVFVKLRNNGTGPLIIRSITFPGAQDPLLPLINAMPDLSAGDMWTDFVTDYVDRSIPAGGEIVLLQLSSQSSSSHDRFKESRDRVRLALGKLAVCVTYTDIYGTSLPVASRSLEFFHRGS